MPNLRKWSQSASGNASVAGGVNTINWQEGQAPSTVNNSAREEMAQIRRVYRPDEWGWVECSATASVASQTTFKLTGDQTADYTANRRVRLTGGSTTNYGTIVSASFTAETTVTITKDSGSLSASMSIAAVSAAYDKNSGQLTSNNVWTGTQGFGASVSFSAAVAIGGPLFASASVSLGGSFALSGDITPAEITANQDNYAPAGYETCTQMRLSSDASRDITGIQGGADGRVLILTNVGSNDIVLKHDATSTAANRFYIIGGVDLRLWGSGNNSAICRYDATLSRWYVISSGAVVHSASSTEMEAASAFYAAVSPFNQHRHPGHPKVWAKVTYSAGTPTTQVSYNLTSITDTGVGDLLFTIATDFSSAHWCALLAAETQDNTIDGATDKPMIWAGTMAAGTLQVITSSDDQITPVDHAASVFMCGLGDQ